MNNQWVKHGMIFCPSQHEPHPKLLTHAANPLPIHVEGDVFRIFFSSRDDKNRSSVGAVDVDIVRRSVVRHHYEPFFLHGPENSFFADGVSIGNCYEAGGIRYMMFMGWQVPENAHWRGEIGRLIVNSDLTLSLESMNPFMAVDAVDPLSLSYPWVMNCGASGYRMWYGSTRAWMTVNGEMLHVINVATSMDGHIWTRIGQAIPSDIGIAQAFSRPTVVRDSSGKYQMWFSFRSGNGTSYRIGYADCSDGHTWVLGLRKPGIDISPVGWDSEMIEYPFVFDHLGRRYMLYNGNGYGLTGFGLAEMPFSGDEAPQLADRPQSSL